MSNPDSHPEPSTTTATHRLLNRIAVELVDLECAGELSTEQFQLVVFVVDAEGTFRQLSLDLSLVYPGKWVYEGDPPVVPVDPLSIAMYAISMPDQRQRGEVTLTASEGLDKALHSNGDSQQWSHAFEAETGEPRLRISWSATSEKKNTELSGEAVMTADAYFEKQGLSRYTQFEKTANPDDIDKAIELFQRSLHISSPDHPELHSRFNNLASALSRRFDCGGKREDIDDAIDARKRATLLAGAGNPAHFGGGDDLKRACSFHKRAIDSSKEDHAKRHAFLDTYGLCLHTQFSYTRDITYLNDAIVLQAKGIQIQRDRGVDDPEMFIYANINLGISYIARFHSIGNIHDIQAGIAALQYAVILSPIVSLIAHPIALANMATALSLRGAHMQGTSNTDFEDAVSLATKAVDINPSTPFRARSYAILVDTLAALYQKTGEDAYLDQAIEAGIAAVGSLAEGNPSLPSALTCLASSLRMRFDKKRSEDDIVAAVGLQRKAVELIPEGHSDLPQTLYGMGLCLSRQFELTGSEADLQVAIACHKRAIERAPPSSPMHSSWFNELSGLYLLIPSTKKASIEGLKYISFAVDCARRAAQHPYGYPLDRLRGAKQWARLSMSKKVDPKSMFEGYELALSLVAVYVGLDQTVRNRHVRLAKVMDLALEAASSAIILKKSDKALEWLEKGRCLVWAQLSSLRSPLDTLRGVDEKLAERFLHLSQSLDAAGSRPRTSVATPVESHRHPMLQQVARDAEVSKHIRLAEEWEEVLRSVRARSGFEDFLKTPTIPIFFDRLPESGPVVVVNVYRERCDALILLSGLDETMHIPLPYFSHKKAEKLRERLKACLISAGARTRADEAATGRGMKKWTREHGPPLSYILGELWNGVAKPILDALAFNRPSGTFPQTRIWWCVTGPLAFLPLHAAGLYDSKDSAKLSDFVISSYIPTVTALISSLKASATHSAAGESAGGLLLVGQPDIPSLPPIKGVCEEVRLIENIAKERDIPTNVLERSAGTIDAVVAGLREYSCAHFACHATQDVAKSLSSGFFLHDGRLELSTLMQSNLESAQLAYLSACHTSAGDEKLSEEAVHLAAGMMAAGYRGVVATMWAIQDSVAPRVAADFYRELLRLWSTDGEDRKAIGYYAPYALHLAVQEMQMRLGDSEDALYAWVPYVHFGL